MTLNGGKAYNFRLVHGMVKASIAIALGSGLHEAYTGNCLFIRDANKSISGLKDSCFKACCKIPGLITHSKLLFLQRDSVSATELSEPGK